MKRICWTPVLFALAFVGCNLNKPDEKSEFKSCSLSSANEVMNEKQTDLLESYQGTYLPETYISGLEKYKSHINASREFRSTDKENPDAIFFNEDTLECVLNFHEGYSLQILDKNEKEITVKTFSGNKLYKLDGNKYLTIGNTRYKKIDEAKNIDEKILSRFIAKTLFPNNLYEGKEFIDGENTIQFKDGTIIYNGRKFFYGTDFVLGSYKYDYLFNNELSETRYIEIRDDRINIYNAHPVDGKYDDGWEMDALFEMESSFIF